MSSEVGRDLKTLFKNIRMDVKQVGKLELDRAEFPQCSANLGPIRFKPCFHQVQVQAELLKMDILEVTAKPADRPEVARIVSSRCNHLPLRSQYCLRISRYAGIQHNQDQDVRDGDKYRAGSN